MHGIFREPGTRDTTAFHFLIEAWQYHFESVILALESRKTLEIMRTAVLTISVLLGFSAAADEPVDFSRDVKSIFNQHCVGCHGGVKQAGGVSFIYRDQVLGEAKSGNKVVVPGDLEASELVYRITTKDEDDRMPPLDEHPAGLTDKEVATLKQWVKEGAKWGAHWAFVAPEPQTIPSIENTHWPRNGIDYFVKARLEAEDIEPAPDADPDRWLRRVSLDLIGLPPNPEERKEFLEDFEKRGDRARAKVVDRLLMSPQFGERWASVWLDQVRYADSKGLGQDGRRNIWKYRDWVIDAFNRDLPYDRFTVKQIAGDLLPEPTMDDLVATAVHRLTQSNEEGGTDDEEFRIGAVIDRVSTTWQTWQGITFGCIQCHSHPYDPIRHDEFYKFAAFFNNTADVDLDEEWPTVRVPVDPDDYETAELLDLRIARLNREIWNTEFRRLADSDNWTPLQDIEASSTKSTELVVENNGDHDEYHTVGTVEQNSDFTLVSPFPEGIKQLTAIRFTGLPKNPSTAVRDSEWGFVLSHVEAKLILPGGEEPLPIRLSDVIGDEPEPFHDPHESFNEKSNRGFGAYTRIHYPRQVAFVLDEPLKIPADAKLSFTIKHRVFILGAFPIIAQRGHLAVSDKNEFIELFGDPLLDDERERLNSFRQQRAQIRSTSIPVLKERPERFTRPTHLFIRGLFLTKDKQVQADVPHTFPPLPDKKKNDRRALAEWLVSPRNPLTARVAVNRMWSRLFGIGIVSTEEDFGSSGEPPTHPELLDHLALRFQNELGWSTKSLLREMVLSRTYAQSAKLRPEIAGRDPQNQLLAMGPRFRLPAETIRDQALAISGLLSRKQFGPPVHPAIPEGVWQPFQGGDRWATPKPGEPDRYRRSVYTYTKRSIPFPMFASFDAPSREFCNPRRLRSNTPLQALMMLNDETLAECARALGQRIRKTEGPIEEKLKFGFLLATGRDPGDDQLAELKTLFETVQSEYWSRPDEANDLGLEPDDAAFAMVGTVLLNLDEVVMK